MSAPASCFLKPLDAQALSRTVRVTGHSLRASSAEVRWRVVRSRPSRIMRRSTTALASSSGSNTSSRDHNPMYGSSGFWACIATRWPTIASIGSDPRTSSCWRARRARLSARRPRTSATARPSEVEGNGPTWAWVALGTAVRIAARGSDRVRAAGDLGGRGRARNTRPHQQRAPGDDEGDEDARLTDGDQATMTGSARARSANGRLIEVTPPEPPDPPGPPPRPP